MKRLSLPLVLVLAVLLVGLTPSFEGLSGLLPGTTAPALAQGALPTATNVEATLYGSTVSWRRSLPRR